jgi:hypothetical protein
MKYLKSYEYSINDFDLSGKKHYLRKFKKSNDYSFDDNEKYNEFMEKYKSLIVDGEIKIYRQIYLSDDWFKQIENGEIKRLGEYWSYDLDSAESWDSDYGRDDKKLYYLVSTIKEKYIDWDNTFELFIIVPWETEIRLYKNTTIEIESILDSNKQELNLDYKYINKINDFKS